MSVSSNSSGSAREAGEKGTASISGSGRTRQVRGMLSTDKRSTDPAITGLIGRPLQKTSPSGPETPPQVVSLFFSPQGNESGGPCRQHSETLSRVVFRRRLLRLYLLMRSTTVTSVRVPTTPGMRPMGGVPVSQWLPTWTASRLVSTALSCGPATDPWLVVPSPTRLPAPSPSRVQAPGNARTRPGTARKVLPGRRSQVGSRCRHLRTRAIMISRRSLPWVHASRHMSWAI